MRALVLPIIVPMSTAAIMLLAPRRPVLQRWIGLAGSLALLASTVAVFVRVNSDGIQVLQISGWPAPFGITLVADLLSALLLVAVGIVAVAVGGAAFAGVDPRREAFGYHPLIQILLMGVSGAFLTGDFFNLYVWFEVMLVASFVLMALHRNRAQLEAAFKYVTINLIASSIFLTALGLLYGVTGTLNMADVARVWPAVRSTGMEAVLGVLFLIAFSIKAGLFPLFFWLPASYHTPPAAVGAVFAGLLTKVGVYALLRIFTLLFQGGPSMLPAMLLAMSAATMAIGLVAAQRERDFRRILSFNLVGHIGYTTASLALVTPAALAAAIFYVLHHIIVITNLFLVSGVLLRLRRTTNMKSLGGFHTSQPLFAAIAMVPIFSLAGVPPLSGFLGKLAILEGAFAAGAYWVGGVVLVVGLLTLLSMGRTWAETFWQPTIEPDRTTPGAPLLIAISGLSLVTLAISWLAGPLFDITLRAATQLLQPEDYIRIVLEERPEILPGGILMSVSSALQKPARAIGLAAFFAWELLVANVRVALDVLSPRTKIQPAVVAIPLDITSDAEILLLSALINITPGSVTIDLSEDRRTLFVHVMHMMSPEASRHDIKTGFEQRVKRLFE